jgi:hypothetical protein
MNTDGMPLSTIRLAVPVPSAFVHVIVIVWRPVDTGTTTVVDVAGVSDAVRELCATHVVSGGMLVVPPTVNVKDRVVTVFATFTVRPPLVGTAGEVMLILGSLQPVGAAV